MKKIILLCSLVFCVLGCYPQPGPDKSVAGALLGAGWGAGSGAVIGNQVDSAGAGAAIGAGFGAGAGMLTGIGLDMAEGEELAQQRQLDALKVQVASNQRRLRSLQEELDNRDQKLQMTQTKSQVYFDTDVASIRSGAAKELQHVAETIKKNPYVGRIEVHGHSDDTGSRERNIMLSEARSRTVATFLAGQGISLDQLELYAHGANRPVASNSSKSGKQLNRRVEILLFK